MAKEIVLTLPYGLDGGKMLEVVNGFVKNHVSDPFDIAADVCIHRYGRMVKPDDPKVEEWKAKGLPFLSQDKTIGLLHDHIKIVTTQNGEIRGYKHYQPHAHVMIPLRQFDNGTNTGFSKKKDRELDKRQQVFKWREAWQDEINGFFEKNGIDIKLTCKKKVPQNDNEEEDSDLYKKPLSELEQAELDLKQEIAKKQPDLKRVIALKDKANSLKQWKEPTEEELDMMFIQWGKSYDRIRKAKSIPLTKPKQIASILKTSNRTPQRE